MNILLSQATKTTLSLLEEKAKLTNSLIEMRAKNGILIAVGNTISSFHLLKDKKNKPLFNVSWTRVFNQYSLEMEDKAIYDVKLDIYSKKQLSMYTPELQKIFDNQERYWDECHQRWNHSLSILKECPHVLINRI